MVRFLSLVCVINATLIAIVGIVRNSDMAQLSMLCGTFLGAGLGAKVSQKFIESKNE